MYTHFLKTGSANAPKNTQILHEYMVSKDRRVFPKAESKDTRKNLAFLTKLCGFIKKD
jgi:hypothetical protein